MRFHFIRCFTQNFNLRANLHLPRRAGIAGRKAGAGDHTECSAYNLRDTPRLTEISMVEKIKDSQRNSMILFSPTLVRLIPEKSVLLNDGPDDHVAAETAEVIDGFAAEKSYRQYR